jgi:aromatic-amino-acid transaminase
LARSSSARQSRRRIFVGQPTWPNHVPLIGTAGLQIIEHPFYDRDGCRVLFDEMMAALNRGRAGDLVLVHGCCHNPTGADLSPDQWQALAELVNRRGLIPFIDLAYQGLGHGLEPDARGTRLLVEAADQALVAHSNDKNFGVYRDRVGSLHVKAPTAAVAQAAYSNLLVWPAPCGRCRPITAPRWCGSCWTRRTSPPTGMPS